MSLQSQPCRVDATLFSMLGIHVTIMAFIVQLEYQEYIFTLLIGAVYGPVLASTILLHEIAKSKTREYLMNNKDSSYNTPLYNEFLITTAGPLSHFPQGLFWRALYIRFGGSFVPLLSLLDIDIDNLKEGGAATFISAVAIQAFVMNAVMLNLNMLVPVHPFPGARALVAVLVLLFGLSLSTAGFVTATMGIVVGLGIFWVGLFLCLVNYTIISVCLVGLSCYTMFSGVRLLRMTAQGLAHEHVLFQQPCYRQTDTRTIEEEVSSDDNEESIA